MYTGVVPVNLISFLFMDLAWMNDQEIAIIIQSGNAACFNLSPVQAIFTSTTKTTHVILFIDSLHKSNQSHPVQQLNYSCHPNLKLVLLNSRTNTSHSAQTATQ